jgi:hypothetical protein
MGYAIVPFAHLKAPYSFRNENPRMVDTHQIDKIGGHIARTSLQNKFPKHAMNCIVKRGNLDPECLSGATASDFKWIQFSADNSMGDINLDFVTGQHRYTWLITRRFNDALSQRNKLKKQLAALHADDHRYQRLQGNLQAVEKDLEDCVWLVSFYDKGIHLNST